MEIEVRTWQRHSGPTPSQSWLAKVSPPVEPEFDHPGGDLAAGKDAYWRLPKVTPGPDVVKPMLYLCLNQCASKSPALRGFCFAEP